MNQFLAWMVAVALVALVVIGSAGYHWVIDLPDAQAKMERQDWLDLASFMTNILTPLFAFLSLCVLVSTLRTQNHQIELAKHSNAIAGVKANLERLSEDLRNILIETKINALHVNLNLITASNLYEIYISKSLAKGDNLPHKGRHNKDKWLLDHKLRELAIKLDLYEENLCELELMTRDYSRRKEAVEVLKMLMEDMKEHGYLKHAIERRDGSITRTTPSMDKRVPLV